MEARLIWRALRTFDYRMEGDWKGGWVYVCAPSDNDRGKRPISRALRDGSRRA